MSKLLTIEALDNGTIGILLLFLRAFLRDMTKLLAVAALGNTTINWLTSIGKTLKILLWSCWPKVLLTRARRVRRETPSDRELLIKVALQVHVGVSNSKFLLISDQIDWNILGTESLLQSQVSSVRSSLNILMESFLDIIKISLLGTLLEIIPSFWSRNVLDVVACKLTGILTLNSLMTLLLAVSADGRGLAWTIGSAMTS